MAQEHVPADYTKMDLSEAKRFDKMVRENFTAAIVSTVKQIVEDYGVLGGIAVDVGSGTALFAIELCRHTELKIHALEKERAIYEVACENIKWEGLTERITPVLGDANDLPFESEFADFVISRGSYHCWEDKEGVFGEIYRVLKRGGIGLVGGGFGRYVTGEELKRMKALRDRSLKEDAGAYSSPEILREIIDKAGIPNFSILDDPAGFWVEIKK